MNAAREYRAIAVLEQQALHITANSADDAEHVLLEMSHPSNVVMYALLDVATNEICKFVEVYKPSRPAPVPSTPPRPMPGSETACRMTV